MNILRLSLAWLFALATLILSHAEDFEVNGIYYNINGDGASVSVTYKVMSYDYSGDIIIPSDVTHKGTTYSVTSIDYKAFYGCRGLASVTIPNSVTSICDYAFGYCSGLTSVTIPNSVTSIGSSAFRGCSGLTSVQFNAENCSDLSGTYHWLSGCNNITTFTFGENVKTIPAYLCYGLSKLASVTIPSSVTSIGNYQTHPVKTIWLTNTPPSGYSSLSGSTNYVSNEKYTSLSSCKIYPFLSSIFDVDGVRYVPVSPSERTCDAIDCLYSDREKTININKTVNYKGIDLSVENINDYCFYKNDYIENVNCNINNRIGDYCFSNCTNIQTISLISGGSIGAYSFENCYNISELNMTCQTVDNYAFKNSMSTQMVIANVDVKQIGASAFRSCSKLQQVTLGNGVETIGKYAFSGCSSLDLLNFGSGMKTIGEEAFSDCTNVTKISTSAINPPVCGNQALDDINKWECQLFVPEQSINIYKSADQWKEFFFIGDAEEISIEDSNISVENGMIINRNNEMIEVYSLSGAKVYTGYDAEVSLTGGMYIVKVGDKVVKIAI